VFFRAPLRLWCTPPFVVPGLPEAPSVGGPLFRVFVQVDASCPWCTPDQSMHFAGRFWIVTCSHALLPNKLLSAFFSILSSPLPRSSLNALFPYSHFCPSLLNRLCVGVSFWFVVSMTRPRLSSFLLGHPSDALNRALTRIPPRPET